MSIPREESSSSSASTLLLVSGALLLCASGCCALVYQTVWIRELRVIFGASTASTSAVLALFLGGLGLGAWLLGPRIERIARPLAVYALLELATAGLAAASPFAIDVVHRLCLAAGGRQGLGVFALPVQLLLGAAVLIGPTALMGGTLPAMARAITREGDAGRRAFALVYGCNTLGAVLGTLATTFLLFELVGLRVTLWWAAGLNAIVALVARSLARNAPVVPIEDKDLAPRARAPASVLIAAFLCGFVFLLFELVWYRLLASLLGGSSYSFNVVLAMALAGIGIGGLVRAGRTNEPSWIAFGMTLALEAMLLIAPLALGDELPFFAHAVRSWGQASFASVVFGWCLLLSVVVLPGALVSGYQFPLLISLAGKGREGVAVDSAGVYAANTLGSILGSLLTGFFIVPHLGAWHTAVAGAVCLAALASVIFLQSKSRLLAVLVLLSVSGLATRTGPGPVWRGTSVGAGRALLASSTRNERSDLETAYAAAEVRAADGIESGVTLLNTDGFSLLVNGKSDGNTIGDAQTTVGAVLLPALLHPEPRRAFVVGLGTGQSAGWLAAVPSIEQVVVAELEERVVDVALTSADTNHDVLRSPKVRLVLGDGREALQSTSERFDVVMSEPSNPYRAGVAGFYSTDFYAAARTRLADDGLFAQWIQGYDVDAATIQIAVATMHAVFPHVTIWRTSYADLLLLASMQPISLDLERVRMRLPEEPFKTAFHRLYWFTTPEDLATLLLGGSSLSDALASAWEGGLNSDDLPLLEFAFARTAGTSDDHAIPDLDALSRSLGADWLPVRGGTIAWDQVRARRGIHAWPLGSGGANPVDAANLVAAGALPQARERIGSLVPSHPAEALMELRALVVDAGSAADDERVGPRLAVLRATGWETEACFLELERALALRGDVQASFQAFAERLRTDPWLAPGLTTEATQAILAGALATPNAASILRVPFAGGRLALARRDALLALHARDVERSCVDFFDAAGMKLPWRRDALTARLRCYQRHAPARAEEAATALALFDSAAPTRFIIDESEWSSRAASRP